jgi:hypothetical protein
MRLNSILMIRREEFFLVWFLFVFILISCQNERSKSEISMSSTVEYMLENQNKSYASGLLNFDTSLTQHFPQSLDTTNLQILKGSMNGGDIGYLEVTNRINEESMGQKYDRESIGSYAGDDTCVLAYHRLESLKKYPASRFRQCLIGKYPIPDFRGNKYRDMGNESRLPSDFMIHVLDSKPENAIPDSLIISNNDLLKKWEHGFSRGVAVSESKSIVIYWIMIW